MKTGLTSQDIAGRFAHLRLRALQVASRPYARLIDYEFDPAQYPGSFLARAAPESWPRPSVPRRVFVLWTGDNPMTLGRERSLAALRRQVGVAVELVTPSTLSAWVKPEHPPHHAYEHLSLVHRADYLRAYLLHHHGGGYADLKAPLASWAPVFEAVEMNPHIWLAGYRELGAAAVAQVPGRLGLHVSLNSRRLVGVCAMIARSGSPLTGEWLREVDRLLDYYGPHIAEHPGGVGGAPGYPIPWAQILSRVLHPLQLKYLSHLHQDDRLLMKFSDYR